MGASRYAVTSRHEYDYNICTAHHPQMFDSRYLSDVLQFSYNCRLNSVLDVQVCTRRSNTIQLNNLTMLMLVSLCSCLSRHKIMLEYSHFRHALHFLDRNTPSAVGSDDEGAL